MQVVVTRPTPGYATDFDASITDSGVATPGPTKAQTLIEFVCALVKLLNSYKRDFGYC